MYEFYPVMINNWPLHVWFHSSCSLSYDMACYKIRLELRFSAFSPITFVKYILILSPLQQWSYVKQNVWFTVLQMESQKWLLPFLFSFLSFLFPLLWRSPRLSLIDRWHGNIPNFHSQLLPDIWVRIKPHILSPILSFHSNLLLVLLGDLCIMPTAISLRCI